jgi:hypothetical protein
MMRAEVEIVIAEAIVESFWAMMGGSDIPCPNKVDAGDLQLAYDIYNALVRNGILPVNS